MTPESVGPLSRLVDVRNIPPRGQEKRVDTSAEERAALARPISTSTSHRTRS
jgi:hypothetical protein